MDDDDPYYVQQDDAGFRVRDDNEVTLMTCSDRRSAEHYATLLNRAYRKGFKAGFREARHGRGR